MLARFEVRVGEAEENFGEGGLGEEVGEEFHGVGAESGDVVVDAGDGMDGLFGWGVWRVLMWVRWWVGIIRYGRFCKCCSRGDGCEGELLLS